MIKKKRKISDLFYNNRFLLVFSLIVATGFWLVASVEFSAETENTIKNVNVQIDYDSAKNLHGLEPFGETDFTVDVVVKGRKYVVNADDIKDDIVVKTTTAVNNPGTWKLKLDVKSKSKNNAYEIVGMFENNVPVKEIEVYFDYPKTQEFAVEYDIQCEGFDELVPDGYYLDKPEKKKVIVSGPESQVNSIDKIVASAKLDKQLTENTTITASLKEKSKSGSALTYIKYDASSKNISVNLNVYKMVSIPVEVSFSNKPVSYIDDLPFTVTYEPATALLGIPEKKLEGINDSIVIKEIDFSELRPGLNQFTIKAAEFPAGVVVLDGTAAFHVTVEMKEFDSVTIEAPETIKFNNIPDGLDAELSTYGFKEITIYGPKESLDKITKENIELVADLKDIDKSQKGEVSVPVKFSSTDCWVYGDYYASVKIS